MARKVKMIDVSKCMACRGCQAACKNWNQLPAEETEFVGTYENPADLSDITWCRVKFNDSEEGRWFFAKYQCMHCTDAACMNVCPAKAISRTSMGTVKVGDECIACGLCATVCPFEVPRIGAKMMKCTQCFDRVSNNMIPACAKACPTGAITFGDLDDKISEAEARVGVLKDNGFANAQVYGKDECGGLGVIYVLADTPDKYGLPVDPEVSLTTYFWNVALGPVKALAAVGITMGFMTDFIKNKAAQMEKDNVE